MNGFNTLYTTSLMASNVLVAGVMYLLSSPVFATVLVALGVLILLGTIVTDDTESVTTNPSQQV